MKKIDLTQVTFLDVEGREVKIDITKQIGNVMFMQGKDIVEHELGAKIYHSSDALKGYDEQSGNPRPDCSFEIADNEFNALMEYVKQSYSYVVQKAVKDALKAE